MAIPKIEDCECDDFREYCEWGENPMYITPNGYSACEGCNCQESYDMWVEEKGVTCEICKDEFILNYCFTIEDVNGVEHYVCEECYRNEDNDVKKINIRLMGETV